MIFFFHSGKFGFVQRMAELSSTWLLARVSMFVFLVTMTDLSWDIADLILQTSSLLETRYVATLLYKLAMGFSWLGMSILPSHEQSTM